MSHHPVRTLIVEDQSMFRGFLERWLSEQVGFVLVGSAQSAEAALDLIAATEAELVLLDLRLPGMDGVTFARTAREVRPKLRILVLSSDTNALVVTRVQESGVDGFIEKNASVETLAEALKAIVAGRNYFSPKFTEIMRNEAAKRIGIGKVLTRREQQILDHVMTGRTSREIGALLGLNPRTVDFHRSNLLAKTGAATTADLMARVNR